MIAEDKCLRNKRRAHAEQSFFQSLKFAQAGNDTLASFIMKNSGERRKIGLLGLSRAASPPDFWPTH